MFLLDNRDSSTESWGDSTAPLSLELFRPRMLQKELDSCRMAISFRKVLTFWKSHFSSGCKRTSLSKIVTGNFCCQNFFVWLSFFTKLSRKLVVVVGFGIAGNEACLHQPQAGKNFLQVAWERKDETTVWVLDEKKRHWGMETFIFLKEKFTVALSGNSFCWKIALYGF